MEFNTLEKLSIDQLTKLFNKAFSDYIVKIQLTPEFLQEKIISENIRLDKSIGAFSCGKPVGFIFHALRKIDNSWVAYNAGTGVIPEFRGNNTTVKMYENKLSELKHSGVSKILLEVIDKNTAAIKSYKKVGFKKTADLDCYKGTIETKAIKNDINFKEINITQCSDFFPFWDWQPTWQHSLLTLQQLPAYRVFGAYVNNELAAYAIMSPKKGRVPQFCVKPHFRRNGIGTQLFIFLSNMHPDTENLHSFNINRKSEATSLFLKSLGMDIFLSQHQMQLTLNS